VIAHASVAEEATSPGVPTVASLLVKDDGAVPISRHAVPVLVHAPEPRAPSRVSAFASPTEEVRGACVVLFCTPSVVETFPQPRAPVCVPSLARLLIEGDGSSEILRHSAGCPIHAPERRARRSFSAGALAVAFLRLAARLRRGRLCATLRRLCTPRNAPDQQYEHDEREDR
jgi:hypothetical protein